MDKDMDKNMDKDMDKNMDDVVFTHGKYKGETYKYVRTNHTEYFMYLIAKPAGTVYRYLDFIRYCLDYISTED
jgi:hypothetical protein